MTRNRIRSLCLAILLVLGTLSSPLQAARSSFSENLPLPLYFALADTAREGEPLLRAPAESSRVPRRVALMAAFEILGWGHEVDVAGNLCPEGFSA